MLYILWGDDDYSREEALQNIKNKLGDVSLISTNTTILDGSKVSLNEIKACAEVVPFLSDKRLVIIRGLLERFESKVTLAKAKKASIPTHKPDETQAIIDCLKALPQTTVMILTDKIEMKKNSLQNNPLYKGVFDKAEIKTFPLLKGIQLSQWIQSKVNEKGGGISRQATEILMDLIGGDLHTLENEIAKLTTFTAGRLIEEKDVRMVVSAAQEADIFGMVDAIIDHKVVQVENILQNLLKNGVSPSQILILLARQIQMMILLKDLKNQKKSLSEIQTKMGISNGFVWGKISARAEKNSMDSLKRTYRKLLETDIVIKTGKLDGDLALSLLVVELSATE